MLYPDPRNHALLRTEKRLRVNSASINWEHLDTILLDLDGTLLDLHYDNYFWLDYVPKRWAEQKGRTEEECRQHLHLTYDEIRGTLDWYCLDYWSDRLGLDLVALKKEVLEKISLRPDAERFLEFLQSLEKKVILVTNGHRDGLEIKLAKTGISSLFSEIVSSHDFQVPKEQQSFWQQLQQQHPFEPEKTLFVDDNESVLQSAQLFGIQQLLQILQPDMQQPARTAKHFPAIQHFSEILD
jgi:5'-nucleotidase